MTRNEYYFDRNRSCFEAILYYYQSNGRLRRPTYVPIDIFLEEVSFFQLGQEALDQLRKDENITEVKKVHLPKNRFRRHLWATMEYPDYSVMAKIISIISLILILTSTITLAIETLPQYENIVKFACNNSQYEFNSSLIIHSTNTNEIIRDSDEPADDCRSYLTSPFFIIQSICVGFFTIELFLRILSTPSLIDFIKTIMNWIDILAVVPYYVTVGIYAASRQNHIHSDTYIGLRLLRILRFTRVLKFYRIFRNVKSLRALAATLRESLPDFFIMINILTLFSFLFGAAAYFAENDTNTESFDSIIKATYWGIITITSVG